MKMTEIIGFNPTFIQKQRKGWGYYKTPTNFVCSNVKINEKFREIHDYKPNFDEDTQYIKFIGKADLPLDVTPYILNVYQVFSYPVATEETTEN